MTSFSVDFDSAVTTTIRHLPPQHKLAVKASLRALSQNPSLGKPLQEDLHGYFSYRVGSLRIIYSVERARKKIHVVAVGPRRNIYERLENELRRK